LLSAEFALPVEAVGVNHKKEVLSKASLFLKGEKGMKPYIQYLRFIGQKRKGERMLKVGLSNRSVVKIVSCYEGWEQFNATTEEKKLTVAIAEMFNDWLHGGELPYLKED
jgi:hypothetical protein